MGKVLSVSYAHNVDATTAAGAEVSKRLDDKDAAAFTLGCVYKLCSCLFAYVQAQIASMQHDGQHLQHWILTPSRFFANPICTLHT